MPSKRQGVEGGAKDDNLARDSCEAGHGENNCGFFKSAKSCRRCLSWRNKRRMRPQEECFVRSVALDAHDFVQGVAYW